MGVYLLMTFGLQTFGGTSITNRLAAIPLDDPA